MNAEAASRPQPEELGPLLLQWLQEQEPALLPRAQALYGEAAPEPPEEHAAALLGCCYAAIRERLTAQIEQRPAAPAPREPDLSWETCHLALESVVRAARKLLDESPHPRAEDLVRLLRRETLALGLQWLEEELRRCHADAADRHLLDSVFEQAADPLVVLSIDTERLLAHNLAAARLSGYSHEQLAQLRLGDLLPTLTRNQLLEMRERLHAEGHLYYDQAPLRRADGEQVQISIHASLMRYRGQDAVLAVVRDMTGVQAQQAHLAAHVDALQQELDTQAEDRERLRRFFENVIDALPLRLMVLDETLRVIHANPAYYQPRGLTRDQVIGQRVEDVFPAELLEQAGLRRALEGTLATGERVWWSGFREQTPGHPERIVNIRVDPCRGPQDARALLVTIEDVSERYRQIYERTLLHEVSQVMLSTLDLPRLLHAILTGITAGGAVGLGFNRAVLMLVDEEAGLLQAEMAVGPESGQEAQAIWSEVSGRYRTLQDFLQDYDRLPPPDQRPLHELVERLVVPLADTDRLPMRALLDGDTVHVMDATSDPRVNPDFAAGLETTEFVVAPLLVGERRIGVALADNFVTRKAIRGSDVHLLTSLANQAALAIDRAQLFQEARERAEQLTRALQELQAKEQEALRNERLATIGQVTEAVAHEIRNPLSTIGGFGRAILRDLCEEQRTRRAAEIIVEESDRLEELLRGLLDFSRPEGMQLRRVSLAEVVASTLELTAGDRERAGINTEVHMPADLPEVELDPAHFRQVLLNLIKNALEAMPAGGTLTTQAAATERGVELSISDTGNGIPPDDLERIFDSFFTTKPTGTGLGLAITRKILDAHHAQVEVHSEPDQGARFTIILPYPAPPPTRRPEDAHDPSG